MLANVLLCLITRDRLGVLDVDVWIIFKIISHEEFVNKLTDSE